MSLDNRKLEWFNQSRFGMFIHWGIYSILGCGEQPLEAEKIPLSEYENLVREFNPKKFNAKEWVSLAKSAGMKYMVLTTKHHDGFCLFDSKLTDYTSINSPAKKDFVAEYVRACRKEGIRIGFYYSLLDWHHPDYQASLNKGTPISKKYIDYYQGQVKELCSNYGKIDIMWFDGEWGHSYQQWKSKELVKAIRKLQPTALINNRLGSPRKHLGDFDTPEVSGVVKEDAPGISNRPWESCMTMNDNWGYAFGDHNWKTARQLIYNLVAYVAGGGNYLLNVGPKADGTIPSLSVKRLEEIGRWMKKNGESIYDAGYSTFPAGRTRLTTQKGNSIYLHVFTWFGERICIADVKSKVNSAYVLATGEKVKVVQKGNHLFLRGLPKKAPDSIDTVIVLKLGGEV